MIERRCLESFVGCGGELAGSAPGEVRGPYWEGEK